MSDPGMSALSVLRPPPSNMYPHSSGSHHHPSANASGYERLPPAHPTWQAPYANGQPPTPSSSSQSPPSHGASWPSQPQVAREHDYHPHHARPDVEMKSVLRRPPPPPPPPSHTKLPSLSTLLRSDEPDPPRLDLSRSSHETTPISAFPPLPPPQTNGAPPSASYRTPPFEPSDFHQRPHSTHPPPPPRQYPPVSAPPSAPPPLDLHPRPHPPPPQYSALEARHHDSDSDGSRSDRSISPNATHPQRGNGVDQRSPAGKQYLGQRDIPGEGPCHIYSDGSHVKAFIGSEPVNPDWGITKAGKPRKRLAQACINCREKKIKCEPGINSCTQCQKLGRECTRLRSQPHSPENEQQQQQQQQRQRPERASSFERTVQAPSKASQPAGAPADQRAMKRSRPSIEHVGGVHSKDEQMTGYAPGGVYSESRPLQSAYHADADPFDINRNLASTMLELYFIYADYHGAICVLPRGAFTHWAHTSQRKTADDRIALYAVLALGSVFGGAEVRAAGHLMFEIAHMGSSTPNTNISMQLALAKLLLARYHLSKGAHMKAFESTGGGCTTLSALGFNIETGVHAISSAHSGEFGLSGSQLIECRRRVFWCGYTSDRYAGCKARMLNFADENIFLRLPSLEADYEAGRDIPGPFFSARSAPPVAEAGAGIGRFAQLITLISNFGAVGIHTHKAMNSQDAQLLADLPEATAALAERLRAWEAALPLHMKNTTQNTILSAKPAHSQAPEPARNLSTYLELHVTFHASMIRLHRYTNIARLPRGVVLRHIRACLTHSRAMLGTLSDLVRHAQLSPMTPDRRPPDLENAVSQPGHMFAILLACDTLSAGGRVGEELHAVKEALAHAKTLMQELARCFAPAEMHVGNIDQRLCDLSAHAMVGTGTGRRSRGVSRGSASNSRPESRGGSASNYSVGSRPGSTGLTTVSSAVANAITPTALASKERDVEMSDRDASTSATETLSARDDYRDRERDFFKDREPPFWRMPKPMSRGFAAIEPSGSDVIYETDDELFFEAVSGERGWGA